MVILSWIASLPDILSAEEIRIDLTGLIVLYFT